MDDILLNSDAGVAHITLNRPQHKNSLTPEMLEQLGAAYRHCDEDDAIRVVVVTGKGDSFSVGADLSAGADSFGGRDGALDFSSCPLSFQAWDVRKPVIAACNGHALGIGMGIALQADMRIVAEEGKYGFLQNRRGIVADFAAEYLLPRLVGFERAFELLVRASRLTGVEAVEWGLAGRVLPAAEVLEAALEIAADMATNCSPLVMGMHKRLLWRSLDMKLPELIGEETRALHHSMRTPDAAEGGRAWLEKRAPVWGASISRDWPDFMG